MKGPIGFLARAQIRRRWRTLGALAVLVGVIGGLALALVAGARRSASVVDRYFAAGIPYDLQIFASSMSRGDVLDLPGVIRADPSAYLAMMQVESDGTFGDGINGNAVDWSSADPMVRVLDGEVPDGTDPFEVMVNEAFVDLAGRAVGDDVEVQMFGLDQADEVAAGTYEPTGPRYTFRIAAVVRMPTDIAVDETQSVGRSATASANGVLVSHEFYEEHRQEFLDFGLAYDVDLTGGRDVRNEFIARVEAQAREIEEPALFGPPRFQDRRASLESPVELETNALLMLGVGVALAGAVTIALLLRAEQRSHEDDQPTLRALGCTPRQLGMAAMLRALPVALGGSIIAVALAIALSSRFPVGIGRQLELDSGVALDAPVVALGGVAGVLVIMGLSFLLGRATPKRGLLAPARPTVAGRLAAVGAPADVVIGTHLAFGGTGSRSTPRRAGIAGAAVAIAIVAAVGVYVAGVDRLYSEPIARGWAWDAVIGNVNFPVSRTTVTRLARDPRIEATTVGKVCDASIDDRGAEVLAIQTGGTAPPIMRSGRLPTTAAEIALGARLGRELDARVGDLVRFSVARGECATTEPMSELELTVVGVAIPPVLGETDFGEGAVVTLDAVAAAGGDDQPRLVMARFSGDDPAAMGASLDRDLSEEILTDSIPAEVANLQRVRDLPLIGLVLAGALGTIVLASTLAIDQRRQLRDLAVMRTLGLASPQLRRVMAWQGVVSAGVIALIGIPVGVAVGRALWRTYAEGLGVGAGPITPWLLLLVPLCGAVAVAASLRPAHRAGRTSVAALLRVE